MKKTIKHIALSTIILIVLCFMAKKIPWLALGVFVFIVALVCINKTKRHPFLYYFTLIVLIFTFSIFLRLFLIEIYNIPSGSMENTILAGDKILVEKLTLGPRLPYGVDEIPWVNLLYLLQKDRKTILQSWPYNRLSSIRKPQRNDIIVFNHPAPEKSDVLIKRCAGLPGDTVEICSGSVFINSEKQTPPKFSKNTYNIYCENAIIAASVCDSLQIEIIDYAINEGFIAINTTHNNIEKLKTKKAIKRLEVVTSHKMDSINHTKISHLSHNTFVPFIVPQKGKQIKITPSNIKNYTKSILAESKQIKAPPYTYTFKQDHYFMLGDNRPASIDSRFWGTVPEEKIIGIARTVLFSNSYMGSNWKRILKSTNK